MKPFVVVALGSNGAVLAVRKREGTMKRRAVLKCAEDRRTFV